MPVSGLIVTLEEQPDRQEEGLAFMRAHPALEVGVREGRRVAVVSDTASKNEDRELWDLLQRNDGVQHVDVVFIHFDEEDDEPGDVSATG